MADEDRVAAAAQRLVQGAGVERERALVVAPVGRDPRGGVTAQVRSHRVVSGFGEPGEQVPPGVGGVGEPVEAESQRPVRGAFAEVGELDAVGGDEAFVHQPEGSREVWRGVATSLVGW